MRVSKAHTGFEPVLPEKPAAKRHSRNTARIPPGSELNPRLGAVLERLKERDPERRR